MQLFRRKRTRLRRVLAYCAIGLFILMLASLGALYTYGRFVDRALGAPGAALPTTPDGTPLDRAFEPLVQSHPGQTGLQLVEDNLDAFALRALSARAAGRSIDAQYYIWHRDSTGRLLANELLQAADRGVRVRVLLDDINARGEDAAIFALDSHPNMEVRLFNPSRNREGVLGRALELAVRGMSLNRRMHNKAWIVDGRLAIVGGRNIGDEYFGAGNQVDFQDADLLLAGEGVAQASAIFDRFWNSRAVIPIGALLKARKVELKEVRARLDAAVSRLQSSSYVRELTQSEKLQPLLTRPLDLAWSAEVRVLSDPPEKAHPFGSRQKEDQWLIHSLMPMLEQARSEVLVISPYFVPGENGCEQLAKVAQRGIDTRVLTNALEATDVALVHAGYSRYRECLLEGGVRLYELIPQERTRLGLFGSSRASLHTKAVLIDGQRGFVGSFNVDPRSVELNTEMGVLFSEAGVARKLRANYLNSTSPQSSYRLYLEDGDVRWEDGTRQPSKVWTREPESAWWKRSLIAVMRWLPIESQL